MIKYIVYSIYKDAVIKNYSGTERYSQNYNDRENQIDGNERKIKDGILWFVTDSIQSRRIEEATNIYPFTYIERLIISRIEH